MANITIGSTPAPLTIWVDRCQARILELDGSLDPPEVLDLARALSDRQSCHGLASELAADLLFGGKRSPSAWSDM